MAATVNVAVACPGGGALAGSGWVSSVAGLMLALGGPPLYYQVLFPRIAETWPDSLISGAIGLGVMWLLAACAVGVVLVRERQPPAVLGLRPLSRRWVAFGTGLRGLSDMAQVARSAEQTHLAALRTDC